jgi:hypothetical protein
MFSENSAMKENLLKSSGMEVEEEGNSLRDELTAENAVLRIRVIMLESREKRSKDYAILVKGNS